MRRKKSNPTSFFRALIPPREYSRVVQASFDNMGERRPKSTDRFDPEQVAGWSDGDYPDWLQQEMDYYLPEDLLRQFGSRQNSVINGSFWMIPAENAKAMIAALEARGFTVRSAPRLQFH